MTSPPRLRPPKPMTSRIYIKPVVLINQFFSLPSHTFLTTPPRYNPPPPPPPSPPPQAATMVSPAWPGLFFCFAAVVLLVFATVSSPIWDKISFLDINVNGQTTHFGVFGYTGSSRQLGYTISPEVLGFQYVTQASQLVSLNYSPSSQKQLSQHQNDQKPYLRPDPPPCRCRFSCPRHALWIMRRELFENWHDPHVYLCAPRYALDNGRLGHRYGLVRHCP